MLRLKRHGRGNYSRAEVESRYSLEILVIATNLTLAADIFNDLDTKPPFQWLKAALMKGATGTRVIMPFHQGRSRT